MMMTPLQWNRSWQCLETDRRWLSWSKQRTVAKKQQKQILPLAVNRQFIRLRQAISVIVRTEIL
jgi:hypothetical protein